MIECGVDGLLQGLLTKGIMKGVSLLKFIPLDKGALDRSEKWMTWVFDWWGLTGCPVLEVLKVEDWFTRVGHETDCTLWCPYPFS